MAQITGSTARAAGSTARAAGYRLQFLTEDCSTAGKHIEYAENDIVNLPGHVAPQLLRAFLAPSRLS